MDNLPVQNPYEDEGLKEQFGHFMITRPVADSCTLRDFLKDLRTEEEKSVLPKISGCLITSLAIMHEAALLHHDIHVGNILVHGKVPIYNDFGLPRNLSRVWVPMPLIVSYVLVKQPFISRETAYIRGQYDGWHYLTEPGQGNEKDVFSLGCTLIDVLAVLTGDHALKSGCHYSRSEEFSDEKLNEAIRAALRNLGTQGQYPILMEVIDRMLERDYDKRITALEAALMIYRGCSKDNEESSICGECRVWCEERSRAPNLHWLTKYLLTAFIVMTALPLAFYLSFS
jgi:serine/threonine protein kinase